MNYLTAIKLVLTPLPYLIDAVKTVEKAFPESGNGSVKLGLVRAAIETAYNAGTDALATFDQIWPILQSLIGSIVGLFNSTGVFRK